MPNPRFQATPTKSGKWYVSDLWIIQRGPKTRTDFEWSLRRDRETTRIAGPCDTQEEAKAKEQQAIAVDKNLQGRTQVWQADYSSLQFETTVAEAISTIANENAASCYSAGTIVIEELRKHLFAHNNIASCFRPDDFRHEIGRKIDLLSEEGKGQLFDKVLNKLKTNENAQV
jgi:hypothetical protein